MPQSQTPLIVFAHANSFPAATYNLMFRSLRARGFAVKAVDKFGHDPRYPVTMDCPSSSSSSRTSSNTKSASPPTWSATLWVATSA